MHSACEALMDAATAYADPETVPTQTATACTAAATAHTHPLEPTSTTHEKLAKPFFIRKGACTLGSTWIIQKNSKRSKAS